MGVELKHRTTLSCPTFFSVGVSVCVRLSSPVCVFQLSVNVSFTSAFLALSAGLDRRALIVLQCTAPFKRQCSASHTLPQGLYRLIARGGQAG